MSSIKELVTFPAKVCAKNHFEILIKFDLADNSKVEYVIEEKDKRKVLIIVDFFDNLKTNLGWINGEFLLEHDASCISEIFNQIKEEGDLGYDIDNNIQEFRVIDYSVTHIESRSEVSIVGFKKH